MPRTLPAALTTVMDAGAYEPYIRVHINGEPTNSGMFTKQPIAFRLEATKATVKIPFTSGDINDLEFFRIERGAVINGSPSTISSIWFKTVEFIYDGKFHTLIGEPFKRTYLTVAANSDYETVIETALEREFDTIVPSYEGAAAWKAYQFYPTGRTIVLSPIKRLFTLLQQKYIIFAAEDGFDGTDNKMFFFVATQTRATDYTFTDILFNGNGHGESRFVIWRDEANTVHNVGSSTDIIHNLGFLHSTAADPIDAAIPNNSYLGARSSKLPVHLKYRTGDKAVCLGDGSGGNELNARINVIEVLDLQSVPAWYQIIETLVYFGGTEGGAMPSTIEAAAPYTPLVTGAFNGILTANDNNLQAAMETIDDHAHEVDQRADMFLDSEGDPAAIGTAADGTSAYAARRDHVHAAGGISFSAYLSANQSINSGTFTKIQFNTEEWDIGGYYDNATNYRFTPLIAGKYLITTGVGFGTAANEIATFIYKNGVRFKDGNVQANTGIGATITANALVDMNGTTDYIEIYVYQNSGGALNALGGANYTYFQAALQR